jgi:hypothetical protein
VRIVFRPPTRHPLVLQRFLAKGFSTVDADDRGCKPIHHACDSGSLAVLHAICERGGDLTFDVRKGCVTGRPRVPF